MTTIRNPILPGFHPDPSICRVGDDYYIANSTFEWWPGVRLHHSRDLVHWRPIGYAITRKSQLDMRGNPDSGGVWAPCLTHADGLFWLIYSDVKFHSQPYKESPNYLVTAESIEGPWSEPVFLNASGFDPSLFHDDDGRKYLVNLLWDHRPNCEFFAGIVMQEYDPLKRRLIGPIRNIFRGTELGVTEGPHLYKKDGWYYLLTAEGGTSVEHAVTLARSRDLRGPYEVHPQNPICTSSGDPSLPLQKAGHGDLVQTQTGQWLLVHLCGRKVDDSGRCILGRETAIQPIEWNAGDWPRLPWEGNRPRVEVAVPELPAHPWPDEPELDDFDGPELSVHWNTLREPASGKWLSLIERPGFLRLRGRRSLSCILDQSLVARRVQHFAWDAETVLEFAPENFQQMAGLTAMYNASVYYALCVTFDETAGRCLRLLVNDNREPSEAIDPPIPLGDAPHIRLRVQVRGKDLQFFYAIEGSDFEKAGPLLDATRLSDEYARACGFSFTGAFVGLCAIDLSGQDCVADFDSFCYRPE